MPGSPKSLYYSTVVNEFEKILKNIFLKGYGKYKKTSLNICKVENISRKGYRKCRKYFSEYFFSLYIIFFVY